MDLGPVLGRQMAGELRKRFHLTKDFSRRASQWNFRSMSHSLSPGTPGAHAEKEDLK